MQSAGFAAQVWNAETSVSRFLSHLGCSQPICNVNINPPKLPCVEAPERFWFLALVWMAPQYTPGCISSYILGKDEVTGSNPVISSRNQSEMAGFFVVLGRISQEWARHPAFLLTSILPGRVLSVFPSVFSPFDPFKSPVPQAFSEFPKISFPFRVQPVGRGDGQGGVGMSLSAFYIVLQSHCRRGMSCRRLCLLDVFGRVV